MVGFVSQLALPVKGEARSVKPARHITVAGKALKLKRPRRVVVCAPRALKGARSESRTEAKYQPSGRAGHSAWVAQHASTKIFS